MTYSEWLKQATIQLTGIETPKRDAEIILGFVTQKSRTFLMAFNETTLTEKEIRQLNNNLQRRIEGEPIAYITGKKEFWSLPFKVNSSTIIPRPDTEKLVELALEHLPDEACEILDLGTGTGAVAIAMAMERPDCFFTAIDYSGDAIKLAKNNAETICVKNIRFLQGNWFKPIKNQKFTMVVSNPPYISSTDSHLTIGDVRFEPLSALVANEEGLSDIRHIIQKATKHLKQYGWLFIEHGWQQALAVQTIFKQQGFQLVKTYTDYSGNDRVTLGRWFKP